MQWESAATNRLLSHIEDEKGPQSRYIVSKKEALEDIRSILKAEFQVHLEPRQISNKIRHLFREHRKPNYRTYKHKELAVLFVEGRGVLDSYTNPEVLRRRGTEEGMISPLAERTIKQLDLTPSLRKRRRGLHPKKKSSRPVRKSGRPRTARTPEFAGSAQSSQSPAPGGRGMPPFPPLPPSGFPAGSTPPMPGMSGQIPFPPPDSQGLLSRPMGGPGQATSLPPVAKEEGQQSTISVQLFSQGELTSSPAAASSNSVPGAQTHTSTHQNMGNRNFASPQNPAPFSAEPRVPQSINRRRNPHNSMETPTAARYSPVAPSHSPVTPPLGVRPQITEGFSHPRSMPSEPTLIDEPRLVPRPELRVPDSIQKIIDFIGSNPRQSLPNHDHLRNLGYSISICINKAVCNLLRATNTDPNEDDLHVITHIHEPPFFQLCHCIYGVNSTDVLIERVCLIQVQSRLSLGDFLRSVTAAAVYNWVLKEKPAGLPAKTEYSQLMEKNIADLSPELLDRLTWKMRYDFVQAPQALGGDSKTLSYRFLDSIRSFLQENLTTSNYSALLAFRERLTEVFSEALKLARQTSLKADELSFKWALSDRNFDPTIMQADGYANPKGFEKVQVCLSPALIERKRVQVMSDGPRETVVYPALVSLQRLR